MKPSTLLLSALAAAALAAGCGSPEPKAPTRVACIGNSITEGYGHAMQSQTSWPVVLNQMLGDGYIVINCGRSATTLQKKGDYSYWTVCDFSNALLLQPDIVVIKMGTNDTKPQNWNRERFKADYQSLIDTLRAGGRNPRIIVCRPVPAFEVTWGINDSTITNGVIPVVDEIALANNLETIDFHEAMKADSADFPDHIHPNEKAARKMAGIVRDKILK